MPKELKIALVHDYIKEFGGAERVLMTLHEMFPEAPIYTAFVTPGSTAENEFRKAGAKLVPSWANLLIRSRNLYSPLRFLVPLIWEAFDFSKFDVVILSSSGYFAKQIRVPKQTKVICYCHTPPRFIWGYQTSMEWQKKLWPVRLYGYIFGHFLRLYDFLAAQRVNQFIANSENIARRIKKNYRRDSVVIYPPIEVKKITGFVNNHNFAKPKSEFYLWAGRIVGGKGLPIVMEAANKLGVKLKVAGEQSGFMWEQKEMDKQRSQNIEFLGRVADEELWELYATCKAFIVAERDVDFGIVQIEAMAAGAAVVAHESGGYIETIIEGKTGTFFKDYNVESLIEAIETIRKMRIKKEDCQRQAVKFSKEEFVKKMKEIVYA